MAERRRLLQGEGHQLEPRRGRGQPLPDPSAYRLPRIGDAGGTAPRRIGMPGQASYGDARWRRGALPRALGAARDAPESADRFVTTHLSSCAGSPLPLLGVVAPLDPSVVPRSELPPFDQTHVGLVEPLLRPTLTLRVRLLEPLAG